MLIRNSIPKKILQASSSFLATLRSHSVKFNVFNGLFWCKKHYGKLTLYCNVDFKNSVFILHEESLLSLSLSPPPPFLLPSPSSLPLSILPPSFFFSFLLSLNSM
jgi:hypothetical protein